MERERERVKDIEEIYREKDRRKIRYIYKYIYILS